MPPFPVWAIVPVKPLSAAKSRLSPVLTPQARADLVCAMLLRTLDVLTRCASLDGVLVISADVRVGKIADSLGAVYLPEAPPCDLNVSLTSARETACQYGAQGLLVVPADLPCISTSSMDEVLALASPDTMIIVPDRQQTGTNCLFLSPSDAIPFCFGAASYAMHMALARASGLRAHVLSNSPLTLDIDQPEDLEKARTCLSAS